MRIFNSYVGLLDGNHPKQPGFMNAILPEISHPRTWLVTHDVSMSISEWMVGLLEVWVWQIHTNPISETQCNWVWNIWNVSPSFPESPPSPSSPSSRSSRSQEESLTSSNSTELVRSHTWPDMKAADPVSCSSRHRFFSAGVVAITSKNCRQYQCIRTVFFFNSNHSYTRLYRNRYALYIY